MMERPAEFWIADDAAENVHDVVDGFLQDGDIIPAEGQEGLQACSLRFCLARLLAVDDEVQDLRKGLKVLPAGFAPLEVCFETGGRVDPVAKPAYEVCSWSVNGG